MRQATGVHGAADPCRRRPGGAAARIGPAGQLAEIGELIAEQLRQLDEVAYVRFASVYGRFTDTGAFRTEIDRLEGRTEEPYEEPASVQ